MTWRRSTRCNGASACVEVACTGGEVRVRDSKLGDASPVISFTVGEWWSYLAALKTGQLGTYVGPVLLAAPGMPGTSGQWRFWREPEYRAGLAFDQAEVDAFTAGVRAGEFDPDVLAGSAAGGSGPGRGPGSPESRAGAVRLPE